VAPRDLHERGVRADDQGQLQQHRLRRGDAEPLERRGEHDHGRTGEATGELVGRHPGQRRHDVGQAVAPDVVLDAGADVGRHAQQVERHRLAPIVEHLPRVEQQARVLVAVLAEPDGVAVAVGIRRGPPVHVVGTDVAADHAVGMEVGLRGEEVLARALGDDRDRSRLSPPDPVRLPQEALLPRELVRAQLVAHVVGHDRPRARERCDGRRRERAEQRVGTELAADPRQAEGLLLDAVDAVPAAEVDHVHLDARRDLELRVRAGDEMELVVHVELVPPAEQVLHDDGEAGRPHGQAIDHDAHGLQRPAVRASTSRGSS
jgi:hypothetical protein